MQYRANFFVQLLNSVLELITGLGGLFLVFYHTDTLGGWGPNELLAVMGVYMLIGSWIAVAVEPNMWQLMRGIERGDLDYTIVKPADTQLLVSFTQIQIWKLIDIVLAFIVLGFAMARLGAEVGWLDAVYFAVALLSGAAILYSLYLLISTTAFWLVRSWSILRMFQSFYQTGRWPVGIYPGWLRFGLTFIVPVAFAVTVPAEALTGRLTLDTLGLVVGIAVIAFIAARLFWQYGLRNYSGASA